MTNSTPGKRIYQILTAPMRDIPPWTDVTRPRLHLHDSFFNNGAPFSVYPFFKFYFFTKRSRIFYTVAAFLPGPPFSCLRANRIWQKGGRHTRRGGDREPPFLVSLSGGIHQPWRLSTGMLKSEPTFSLRWDEEASWKRKLR